MKLPISLANSKEWTITGPMGPEMPEGLVAHPILCVDGGARFCKRMDIWVGDGDSNQINLNCENIFKFSPHKSQSDLALALTLFNESSQLTLHCWGFLGGRKDHELINLGEMLTFLETKPQTEALFYDQNKKIVIKALGPGAWKFNLQGVFSLASLKNVRVKMTGNCAYEIKEMTELKPLSSFGLSNFGKGEFELINEGPVMMIFPEAE